VVHALILFFFNDTATTEIYTRIHTLSLHDALPILQALRLCTGRTVKCTLVQALRLCTGRTGYRGSRGIALPFLEHGTRRGEGQRHDPAALPPKKTRYPLYRGWVGPRAGLDRCGKSHPHRDSIP
jgi:hypothetical protein